MSSVLAFPPAPSAVAAVQVLTGVLDSAGESVAAGSLAALSDAELLDLTARLHGVSSQVQALAVVATAEVRARKAVTSRGFTTPSRWLEVEAGLSTGESRAALALGETLSEEFTSTRDAWLAGEIGTGAVREITTLIPRRLKALPGETYAGERDKLEALAVRVARTDTVPAVRRAIDRAAVVADPAGADAAVIAAKESEFLSFTPVPDGVEVRGFLSTETAAVVLTAFDQCHDARYRNGALTVDDRDDDARDAGARIARTPGARRARRERENAEILAELVTHLLDGGELGTKHAQRPHLTVTVHSDDFAAGLGGDILLPGYGYVPVPNSTIDRLLCDAEVHPVLTRRHCSRPTVFDSITGPFPGSTPRSTDPPWRIRCGPSPSGSMTEPLDPMGTDPSPEQMAADTDVAAIAAFSDDLDDRRSWWNRYLGEPCRHVLDVGRSYRTAPPKIRHALEVRDGGCAVPGCDVDPSRCQAHHIDHWEHGGETSLANLVLLCAKHHRHVHEGRWRIHRNHDLDPGDPAYLTRVAPTHQSPAGDDPSRMRAKAAPLLGSA